MTTVATFFSCRDGVTSRVLRVLWPLPVVRAVLLDTARRDNPFSFKLVAG